MDYPRLEKRFDLRSGTATVSSTALSDTEVQTIRDAYENGSFFLARTNMAASYTLLSVTAAPHTIGAAGVRWDFTLIYSGEE